MSVASPGEYRGLLAQIYGFESAVARGVTNVTETQLQSVRFRERLVRLRDDLVALGMDRHDVEALSSCTAITVRSPAHAFGWSFVVERSTLVAGLIRRYIASQLPDVVRVASSYLEASSHRAGERLRAFGDVLGVYARREPGAPEAIIAAARGAFDLQHNWYTRAARRARSQSQSVHVAQQTLSEPSPKDAPMKPRDAA